MAKDQTKRMKRAQIDINNDAYAALQKITGYDPINTAYLPARGGALQQDLRDRADEQAQAEAVVKAARDNATAAEWAFHNYVLGAKDQVIAQFGKDSNELQSLGLKKKSEYKNPGKKTEA